MDKKHVQFSLSELLGDAANKCLRMGHEFFLWNGDVYFVSKRGGYPNRDWVKSQMQTLEEVTVHKTKLKENDLTGEKWADSI